jgi:ribulose-5-phosphate 4-epimerase/fuculose-1-phosphate aldolase
MKVIDDGVIKYDRSNFTHCDPINSIEYFELEKWRKVLYQHNLIGEYPEVKIGFGNMSMTADYRHFFSTAHRQFIITGTQTGKYPDLDGQHYTRVLDYDIEKLKIQMMGPIEASSEALTHAAIYESNHDTRAIFHIHSPAIWNGMILDRCDYTEKNIPYGTLEMARATQKCVEHKSFGSFCMHGHEDGVVIYGRSLDEAGELTLKLYRQYIG